MEIANSNIDTQANIAIGAALLTATGNDNDAGPGGSALFSLGDIPFIEFQIKQLAQAGIKQIFLEIDTVPGALLPIADRARNNGIAVDFLRSPADLRGKLQADELLFIMSEGIYLDNRLLAEMLRQNSPYLVTLDGRDENAAFERIDLNSFWAGLALLGSDSIEAIAALPEEWSIGSSLLRRALQDSVLHRPLKQALVDNGQLLKIDNAADAQRLSDNLLSQKSVKVDGWIEKTLLAPLSVGGAKLLWRISSGRMVLEILGALFLLATIGCAYMGLAVPASLSGIAAMLIIYVRNIYLSTDNVKYFGYLYWAVLGVSLLELTRKSSEYLYEGLFAAIVMIGLIFISKQVVLPGWRRLILCSPALFALLIMIFGALGLLTNAMMLIVIIQLFLLIFNAETIAKMQRG